MGGIELRAALHKIGVQLATKSPVLLLCLVEVSHENLLQSLETLDEDTLEW
jgi:hypothetical protein